MDKHSTHRHLEIPKALLTIDLNALNLLQFALFTKPSEDVATRLKHQFGIDGLSPHEILREQLNTNSPFHKYLVSLMMSLARLSKILLSEQFQEFLKKQNRIARFQLKMYLRKKIIRRYIIRQRMRLKRRDRIASLNQIVLDHISYIPLPLDPSVKEFFLESYRANRLRFYLKYSSKETWSFVREIVEMDYRMAKRDLDEMDMLRKNNALSPQKIERLEEQYLICLENQSDPLNLIRVTPQIELMNPRVITKYLWDESKNKEIIYHCEKNKLCSSYRTKKPRQEDKPPKTEAIKYKSSEIYTTNTHEETPHTKKAMRLNPNDIWKYQILKEKLNGLWNIIFDKHKEVVVEETKLIITFQEQLDQIITRKSNEVDDPTKMKKLILTYIQELSETKEIYSPELF